MIANNTRRDVLRRAGGSCEDCFRKLPLELHHKRYRGDSTHRDPDGESVLGVEKPDDLAALCRECHRRRHVDSSGNWWNDPEQKEQYWASLN